MIRKLSLLLTIIAVLGLVVALVGSCGKKGPLKPPDQTSNKTINNYLS
jgi:predicted small lipoprotein YifL